MRGRLPVPSEHEEQKLVVDYLTIRKIGVVSAPLEGKRSPQMAAKLKASGMLPGTPDLILLSRTPDGRSVALEMKRSDGVPSDVKKNQREAHKYFRSHDWTVVVGFGARDAIQKLKAMGF